LEGCYEPAKHRLQLWAEECEAGHEDDGYSPSDQAVLNGGGTSTILKETICD
jgi:hypothetical protein